MKFVVLVALFAAAVATETYSKPKYPAKAPAYAPAAYPAGKSYEYPPSPYYFAYEVKDDYYNKFGQQEKSDGKVTTGSYHVLLPDGRTQIVTYTADYYGYNADVKYEGYAKYPEYQPAAKYPEYKPVAKYPEYKPVAKYPEYKAAPEPEYNAEYATPAPAYKEEYAAPPAY